MAASDEANKERARRGRAAVLGRQATLNAGDKAIRVTRVGAALSGDSLDIVTDTITDILHYFERGGGDPRGVAQAAIRHWLVESR